MKIAYFPIGGRDKGSSRLRVWKIADMLHAQGHSVLFNPTDSQTECCDVAVVQKRRDLGHRMQMWRRAGVKVIWDIDDYHQYTPPADVITIGSEQLRKLYPDGHFIPDALDIDEGAPIKRWHFNMKVVCWYGLPENLYHARPLYEACLKTGLNLTVITGPGPRLFDQAQYIPWSLDTVDHFITTCDLVGCPYVFDGEWPREWVTAKGENRLLKAWALGMPVIGTPIQAYKDAGLTRFATTTDEWIESLQAMIPTRVRTEEAERSYGIAVANKAENVVKQWIEVFK